MFDSKDPSVHCIVIGVQERRLQAGRDGGGGGTGGTGRNDERRQRDDHVRLAEGCIGRRQVCHLKIKC
jgi:hypothetical protein